MITRLLQPTIEKYLYKKKAIIIYGPRQVGKTTLVKQIQKKYPKDSLYLNCDEPHISEQLTNKSSGELKEFMGAHKLILIDEAQRIKNIGLTIKLIVDNFPDVQIIATGSSSLDLSNEIKEPLTGRKYEFQLFPISLQELNTFYRKQDMNQMINNRIIMGMYPAIITQKDDAQMVLQEVTSSYLYKDILQYQDIRKPELLDKLLIALALQIGREVSYNELANFLSVSKETIINYIQLLEKAFIIHRLPPLSRNLRNELQKMRKIYFWDTGIRNALINNFNPLELRDDRGILWENFIINERIKYMSYKQKHMNRYFWRTHQQQEIDYIEEADGMFGTYEMKWKTKSVKPPAQFIKAYPNSTFEIISRDQYQQFVGI